MVTLHEATSQLNKADGFTDRCRGHHPFFGAGGETRTHEGFPAAYKTAAIATMRLQLIWLRPEVTILACISASF